MALRVFRVPDSAPSPAGNGFGQWFVSDLDSEEPSICCVGDRWFSLESGSSQYWDGSGWQSSGGEGGAPTDAQYLVAASNSGLSAEVVVTTAGLALLDDADAAAQRATLGLGSVNNTADSAKPVSTATQAALDGKANSSHSHAQSDVTNLVTDLAGKAASSHTHAQSDVTNLVADLSGKAASSHTHAAADIASGTVATARLGSGTANSSTFLRGDQTWAAPSGGGATIAYKTADQTAIGTAFADVTGVGLAVAANKAFHFRFILIADSDAATTGIDVSCNGPASPTSVNYTVKFWTSATVRAFRPFSAYDGNTASTGSNGATRAVYEVEGVLRNGVNTGTLIARAKRENVGTGPNVRAGSFGILTPLD